MLSLPPLWAAGVPGVSADFAWASPPGHAPRPSAPGGHHAPVALALSSPLANLPACSAATYQIVKVGMTANDAGSAYTNGKFTPPPNVLASSDPAWSGNWVWHDTPATWIAGGYGAGLLSFSGKGLNPGTAVTRLHYTQFGNYWAMSIYARPDEDLDQPLIAGFTWSGTKYGGDTPAGVYTKTGAYDDGNPNTNENPAWVELSGSEPKADLVVNGLTEAQEDSVGLFVPRNDDRDEGNLHTDGSPASDAEAHDPDGTGPLPAVHRIVSGDDEVVPLTLVLSGDAGVSGSFRLTIPTGVKVYRASNRAELVSGTDYPGAAGDTIGLLVEGLAASSGVRTQTLSARFIPTGCTHDHSDSLKLTVFDVDLKLYKPGVIDAASPELSEAAESDVGVTTFVNLDNDDNDAYFDGGGTQIDPEITGGDDEFAHVRLEIQPAGLNLGNATLTAFAGGSKIALWGLNDKSAASAYASGSNLSLATGFTATTTARVRDFMLEGVASSAAQRDVQLRLSYAPVQGGPASTDEAAATILGVEHVEWQGHGNSLNSDDTLTADPNFPGIPVGAQRVFPDARVVSGAVEATPRQAVGVRVTLTVPPPEPVRVYLRAFDVDDPSSDAPMVDDPGATTTTSETMAQDNRGSLGAGGAGKAGQFVGFAPDAAAYLDFAASPTVKAASIDFLVTMQPGDNFRVAANADADFLAALVNDDATQNVGNSDNDKNLNKQRITHPAVSGVPANREVRRENN